MGVKLHLEVEKLLRKKKDYISSSLMRTYKIRYLIMRWQKHTKTRSNKTKPHKQPMYVWKQHRQLAGKEEINNVRFPRIRRPPGNEAPGPLTLRVMAILHPRKDFEIGYTTITVSLPINRTFFHSSIMQ